jgi:NYN domain
MKTAIYIDGFNLYYLALKNSRHKWLNLRALCDAALPKVCSIVAINYYTARVSNRQNPSSPKDQNSYLNALKTLPSVHIHFGNFQTTKKWIFLVQPVEFKPVCLILPIPNPTFGFVVKTEEKASDVNLGAHLVRDAFSGAFEHAVVITNDTDLKEPLRIVVEEAKLPLTLLTPTGNPARELVKLATHLRHARPYLGACQFPDPVIGPKGFIRKPIGW